MFTALLFTPWARCFLACQIVLCSSFAVGTTIDYTITRHADKQWTVEIQLENPKSDWIFMRQTNLFRENQWEVYSANIEIVQIDGRERLQSSNGAPFDHVRLVLQTRTERLERDYDLFKPFANGDLALYTGHFDLTPISRNESTDIDSIYAGYTHRYRFVDEQGQTIVIAGQSSQGTAQWLDETGGWGTYVYFGSEQPIETEHVIAIVDPGLPSWAVIELKKTIPQLFDFYTQALNETLPVKPFVLFGYDIGEPHMNSFRGGVITGVVELEMVGEVWRTEKKEHRERLYHLLAHESAHLWNHQYKHNKEDIRHAWLHEGGAEALAYAALLELGLIDRESYNAAFSVALNSCSQGLMDFALVDATAAGHFDLHYACGAIFFLALEHQLSESNTLFDFWQSILASIDENEYGPEDFVAQANSAVQSQNRDAPFGDYLLSLVETRMDDPRSALVQLLEKSDIAVSEASDEEITPYMQAILSQRAMDHLAIALCGEGSYAERSAEGAWIRSNQSCSDINLELAVVELNAHDAIRSGLKVYDALAAACSNQTDLILKQQESDPVHITCGQPLQPRLKPLRIEVVESQVL